MIVSCLADVILLEIRYGSTSQLSLDIMLQSSTILEKAPPG